MRLITGGTRTIRCITSRTPLKYPYPYIRI